MASDAERLWIRRVITLAALVALLSPVLRNVDGLPLSTYPMYAGTRSNVVAIVAASGVGEDGQTTTLSMPQIADTRDPLIAQAFLNDALGRGDLDRVCREIAGRVGESVVRVEIATERHDVVARTRDAHSLLDRAVHVGCEVDP